MPRLYRIFCWVIDVHYTVGWLNMKSFEGAFCFFLKSLKTMPSSFPSAMHKYHHETTTGIKCDPQARRCIEQCKGKVELNLDEVNDPNSQQKCFLNAILHHWNYQQRSKAFIRNMLFYAFCILNDVPFFLRRTVKSKCASFFLEFSWIVPQLMQIL